MLSTSGTPCIVLLAARLLKPASMDASCFCIAAGSKDTGCCAFCAFILPGTGVPVGNMVPCAGFCVVGPGGGTFGCCVGAVFCADVPTPCRAPNAALPPYRAVAASAPLV